MPSSNITTTSTLLSNIDPLITRSSTPSSTQYSTPLTTNPLRRKRRLPLLDSQDDSEGSVQPKRYASMDRVVTIIEQLVESRRSSLHSAVLKLQEGYSDRLIDEHIDMVLVLLENEVKASIFCGLKPGEIRDRWLERNTGVEIVSI